MHTITLRTSHMVVGGDALARDDNGRVVFVSGALPGETVVVDVRVSKKDFARAEVVEVLDASPHRVHASCEAFLRGCGGCDWMHIDPHAQLGFKVDVVREALGRTARLRDPRVEPGGAVKPWGYRTTVRLASTPEGLAGFRSRRSHDVVPVATCPVAHPLVNETMSSIVGHAAGETTIRVGVSSAHISISPIRPGVVLERVAGRELRVSPASFFQSSPDAAELLVASVARLTHDVDYPTATVLDAYGGVGLFAATVAADAAHVILVEASASSTADAAVNLGGRSVTIECCRVEDWSPRPCNVAVADPARAGLDRVAADVVAATGAGIVVLVSCDAGSLGRDARLMTGRGYTHDITEVIDVFPNTSHVEAVTRFVR